MMAFVAELMWFWMPCATGLFRISLATWFLWLSVVVGAGVADAVVLGAGVVVARAVVVGDGVGLAGGVYLGMSLLGQAAVLRVNSALSDATGSPSWLRYLSRGAHDF